MSSVLSESSSKTSTHRTSFSWAEYTPMEKPQKEIQLPSRQNSIWIETDSPEKQVFFEKNDTSWEKICRSCRCISHSVQGGIDSALRWLASYLGFSVHHLRESERDLPDFPGEDVVLENVEPEDSGVNAIDDSHLRDFIEKTISLETLLKMGKLTEEQSQIIVMYLCQGSDLFVCDLWISLETDTLFKKIKRSYNKAVDKKDIDILKNLICEKGKELEGIKGDDLLLKNEIRLLKALTPKVYMAFCA